MNTPPSRLTIRISWLGITNYLGALLTTGWMLYLLYDRSAATYTVLALLICVAIILSIGASPLLVIVSGVIYFHFNAAGFWLPLVCWLAAGLAFINDLHAYRLQQADNQPPES